MWSTLRVGSQSLVQSVRVGPRTQFTSGLTDQAAIAVIYKGTIALICLLAIIINASAFLLGNDYDLPRVYGLIPLAGFAVVLWYLYVRRHYRLLALMLLAPYLFIGIAMLALWSVNEPTGLLTLGFVIVLAGVMFGARAIVPTTFGLSVVIVTLQLLDAVGWIDPDETKLALPPNLADVATWMTLLFIFALISWLSGKRLEQSLKRALQAEADLEDEKILLERRLRQKTRELEAAHIEELHQLYRFAELGQLSTILLHDLANNLTVLTMDIDDLSRERTGQAVARARESIGYLEKMIKGVRMRLSDSDVPERFDALSMIEETINALGSRAQRAGVVIEYEPSRAKSFYVMGDSIRLGHALTILITNAIEASAKPAGRSEKKAVVIVAKTAAQALSVNVSDHGEGIAPAARTDLFKPFTSHKPDGMGIGLFMAHDIIVRHFGGSLTLDPSLYQTRFVVTIPRASGRP
jgi:signal transduction histidine kinase